MTYLNFVKECYKRYRDNLSKEDCQQACRPCFNQEFFGYQTGNGYSCISGGYYYAISYANTYISEIYHLLSEIKILEKIPFYMEIASLGGGMGTDILAVRKYIHDNSLSLAASCCIYDKAAMWKNIIALYNNSDISFNECDLTQNSVSLTNYDLVFINKLVSTLQSNGALSSFWPLLQSSLASMKNGAYLIFNDINSCYKGRDDFLGFMSHSHEFGLIGKYYFDVRNAHCEDGYTKINNTNFVYDISQLPKEIYDLIVPITQTFFAVYQKEA